MRKRRFGALACCCVFLVCAPGCSRNAGSKTETEEEVRDKGLPPASRTNSPPRIYEERHEISQPLSFADRAVTSSDWEATRNIREAIMADPQLAPAASNVTVVTEHGQVKLTGRVATKHEQRAMAAIVEKQTGSLPASNELELEKGATGQ